MRAGAFFISAEERLKAAIVGWIILIDAWWLYWAGFSFRTAGLAVVLVAMGVLFAVAHFYRAAGRDQDLVVITRETAWLLAFTGAAALLSNLAITCNLPLVGSKLSWFDHAVGFDWAWAYKFVAAHPPVAWVLSIAYVIALPEVAVVMAVLARLGRTDRASELVFAAMLGAIIAIVISTLLPSGGALGYYKPNEAELMTRPIVNLAYKSTFYALRAGSIREFSLYDLKGLIAFPSYHAVLCTVTLLATRGIPRLFWPLFAVSLLILASAPIDGGHFLADVIGGVAVGVLATMLAAAIRARMALPAPMPVVAPVARPAALPAALEAGERA